MKIGLVLAATPSYSETFLISKIKGLQEKGFTVIIFAKKVAPNFHLCKVKKLPNVEHNIVLQIFKIAVAFCLLLPFISRVFKYYKILKNEGFSTKYILKNIYFNSTLLKQKLDWLHFGFATLSLEREYVAKAIGAKMGVSFRGFDINVFSLKNKNCYDLLFKNADKIHSISYFLLEKAHHLGLSSHKKAKIITPAISFSNLPVPKVFHLNQPINIITIARLNWIKAIPNAIKSMLFLKENSINFHYHIVGTGNREEIEECLFLVHELNLKNKITIHGKLSHKDTLEVLNNASVYLQPSWVEGFGNAVLEAQALKKIVIATNSGGLSENIENYKTGFLVPHNDPKVVAQKIIEVLNLPQKTLLQISERAHQRVQEQFSIQKQKEAFVSFYNEV